MLRFGVLHLLLPYQQRWVADQAQVKLCEKSRRIGITWASAADAVLDAAEGKCDTWYIGYSEDQALEFIHDAQGHCHDMGLVQGKHGVRTMYLSPDGDPVPVALVNEESILAYRITFRSGKRVTALSSRPRNLRGKAGRVIIDEAAFHENLPELIKAAMSLLIWGGRVEIISTHNGVDNYFNKILEGMAKGDAQYKGWTHHRITFDDALDDGLYQRICLMAKRKDGVIMDPSPEAQEVWRENMIAKHGVGAGEELFCEPLSLSQGQMFNRTWYEFIDTMPHVAQTGQAVRFWDLAATEKKKGNDPDYTSGTHMIEYGDKWIVRDVIMVHEDPGGVEDLMRLTAQADGRHVPVAMEQEGGSSGKLYSNTLRQGIMRQYRFHAIPSTGDKVTRAKPFSTASKNGKVLLYRASWNAEYLDILHKFPLGRYDDPVDSSAGAFNFLNGGLGPNMGNIVKALRNR